MSPFVGIDHVQVAAPAGCEAAARRFYGELLGLEEIEKPPELAGRGGVWFRVGAQELHVGVSETFVPATKAHPALRLDAARDLEHIAAHLEGLDLPVVRPDPREIPGATRVFVSDPWGNRLELVA